MRRFAFFLLVLSSCASYQWAHSTKSINDFYRDQATCYSYSQSQTTRQALNSYTPSYNISVNSQTGQGYATPDSATSIQQFSNSMTQFSNSVGDLAAIQLEEQCMYSNGWRKVKLQKR